MAPFLLQVSHLPRQYLCAGSLTPSSEPSGVPSPNEILEPVFIWHHTSLKGENRRDGWPAISGCCTLNILRAAKEDVSQRSKISPRPGKSSTCHQERRFPQRSAHRPTYALGQTGTALPGVPEGKHITV